MHNYAPESPESHETVTLIDLDTGDQIDADPRRVPHLLATEPRFRPLREVPPLELWQRLRRAVHFDPEYLR